MERNWCVPSREASYFQVAVGTGLSARPPHRSGRAELPDPQDPTNKLKIAAPPTGFVAPPGYYMLFILDDGVPSIAEIVKLAPAP